MNKADAGQIANDARIAHGVSWADLAASIEAPLIWTIAAVLGQHPMPREQAEAIGGTLELEPAVVEQLTRQPTRGSQAATIPTDPTLYRFYEALMVYGPALKEYIHEEFGDGIMSAINFGIEVAKVEDPAGDRVVVTFNGKFLPYQWTP